MLTPFEEDWSKVEHRPLHARPISMMPSRSGIVDTGVGLDDVDETGFMFVLTPDPPDLPASERLKRRVQRQLSKKAGYIWRFVRVSVRNGVPQLMIMEADDADGPPFQIYDLSNVINVHRVTIPAEEKLKFNSFNENGDAIVETVFGHIGLSLELEINEYDPRRAGGIGTFETGSPLGSPRGGAAGVGGAMKASARVNLALPTTDDREAWMVWFSELVVLRELAEIEAMDDPFASEELIVASPRKLLSTHLGKGALKEYVRNFLSGVHAAAGGSGGKGGDDSLPNKGKINVRPPDAKSFETYVIAGNKQTGEISLTPKKKGIVGGKAKPTKFFMMDAIIVVPMPWSPEFQIVVAETKLWQFMPASNEQRNNFVQWFRIIKGRGKVAQTEDQTFPYLAAERAKADKDDDNIHVAHRFGGGKQNTPRFPGSGPGGGEDDDEDLDDGEESELEDDLEGDQTKSPLTPAGKKNDGDLSDRSSPSLSSIQTIDSVRPFKPFPSYQHDHVSPYVLDCAIPHMLGRGVAIGTGSSLGAFNRSTAQAAVNLINLFEQPVGYSGRRGKAMAGVNFESGAEDGASPRGGDHGNGNASPNAQGGDRLKGGDFLIRGAGSMSPTRGTRSVERDRGLGAGRGPSESSPRRTHDESVAKTKDEFLKSKTSRRLSYTPTGNGSKYVVEPSSLLARTAFSTGTAASTILAQQRREKQTKASPLGQPGKKGLTGEYGRAVAVKRTPIPTTAFDLVDRRREFDGPASGRTPRSGRGQGDSERLDDDDANMQDRRNDRKASAARAQTPTSRHHSTTTPTKSSAYQRVSQESQRVMTQRSTNKQGGGKVVFGADAYVGPASEGFNHSRENTTPGKRFDDGRPNYAVTAPRYQFSTKSSIHLLRKTASSASSKPGAVGNHEITF